MAKRDQDVHFLASKEEVERIHEKMDELGIRSMGAYLRKMALDGYCIRLDLQDVKALVSLLRICSNNLKSAMKQRCDGQRENTLSSLRPTSTNPTFTIISFIIRPRWMPHGNSKTSFFPVWRCKDSVIWFAWNTGCPLLHRSRIGSARKELFIPRSVPSVTNYVMRLMRC